MAFDYNSDIDFDKGFSENLRRTKLQSVVRKKIINCEDMTFDNFLVSIIMISVSMTTILRLLFSYARILIVLSIRQILN